MTTLILGLSCESHSISHKISHPSTHSLFLLAWLVENYRLFLLLTTWQFEKKMKAPKGSVSILCVCLYLCVCVHKRVRVHKVHLTVFTGCSLDASCGQHLWSAVYSFYLKSDLRCDCPVKDLVKGNSGKNKYRKSCLQDPNVLQSAREPEMCLVSH